MTLFIEFHLIQNFAPSNLNRDDTGAPKDAIFGGYRRARISSQCLKRAIRNSPEMSSIPSDCNSVRTKKLVQLLESKLSERGYDDSREKIKIALSSVKLKVITNEDKPGEGEQKWKTEALIFLGEKEIEGLAELIIKYWNEFDIDSEPENDSNKKITKKDAKKKAQAGAPKGLEKEIKTLLNGQKAVDIALYGRMLADIPSANQYAACQVAHAISTHRIEREFDYFTAVDDHGDSQESGAGMIGQIEFNSATFYRYAVLDANKLISNLANDHVLALESIRAFIKSIIKAIPTGKQNSFAAHNLPCFVGIVIRNGSPLNLANAFQTPIIPKKDSSLTQLSVEALANHEKKLAEIYGDPKDCWGAIDLTECWPNKNETFNNINDLSEWVLERVRTQLEI